MNQDINTTTLTAQGVIASLDPRPSDRVCELRVRLVDFMQ